MTLEIEIAEAIIKRNFLRHQLKNKSVDFITKIIIKKQLPKISQDIRLAKTWLLMSQNISSISSKNT